MRLHAGPSTAGQWYEQAIEQEAAGYLAEAVESYRQALLAVLEFIFGMSSEIEGSAY